MSSKLYYCGDCPFLEIESEHEEYFDCPEGHIDDAVIKHEQENKCLLSRDSIDIWKGNPHKLVKEYPWLTLEDGNNPKKHAACLDFTKYLVRSMP